MFTDPLYADLFKLPVAERLQLVEDLWDSIAAEREHEPLSPAVIAVLQERHAQYAANPDDVITWEEAKRRLRSGQ